MKKFKSISALSLLCLGAASLSLGAASLTTTASFAMAGNQVAGTWQVASAKLDHDGTVIEPFGPHPIGLLIFTKDLHFAETIVNPGAPKFASANLTTGTDAENKAAMSSGLGNSGTYTIDNQGGFSSEHLISSTFPNWDGLNRDTRQITEVAKGDTMTERLQDPGGPQITIIWQKVK